ncbi:MAG: SGNH/GDSL hydrolase family protein, partial [Clostridia bacterium]|nr:SGNH/GDSL hydrolase family protein [Clostridia bacterium]
DIRTSTNAVVYDSAGSAVRGQLVGLKNQIDTVLHRFCHVYNLLDIGYSIQNVAFQHTEGTTYPNGKIVSGTKNIVIMPVSPANTYYFTQLSSMYYHILLFDNGMNFISTLYSYHNNSGDWNAEWTIPENCYYVAAVIDDSFKDTAFFGLRSDYSKWTAGYRFDTNQTENNSQQNNALKTDFRTDCLKLTKNILVPDNTSIINLLDIAYVLNGKSFNTSTGEIIEGSSTVKIIPVTPGASYYYTQLSNIYYNILLYDNDMNFISTMHSYHNNTGSWNAEWSVPDNCHFVAAIIGRDYQDSAYFGTYTGYALWTDGYKKVIGNDNYIVKQPDKNHKLVINANSLGDTEQLQLNVSDIKQNYSFSFQGKINSNFSSLKIGHGLQALYSGMYVEITEQVVRFYQYMTSANLVSTFEHHLNISQFINVTVNILQDQSSEVIITTLSGSYKCSNKWQGSKEKIAVEVNNCTLTECKLTYYCQDYDKKIWAFGDSYFYDYGVDRWPKIAIDNGFTNVMFDGFGGRTSVTALQSLNKCLSFGCPNTILWCMGMNDPDSVNAINSSWENSLESVKNICNSYNIKLIVCTIPTTPTNNNNYKNALIRNSDMEYIDIADALGADGSGSWYNGLLSGDNVHPTAKGSKVIAAKMMAELPEMFG